MNYGRALIIGAGEWLNASPARLFAREGMKVVPALLGPEKPAGLCSEPGARGPRVEKY